jgi:hypothetical protein
MFHRSLTRRLNRRLHRPLSRRCTRRTVRIVAPGPRVNYFMQALTAFRRAVRARCRLMRLAPEIFDATVVQRDAERREERRQWTTRVESALEKVYGPAAGPTPGKRHHNETDGRCGNGAEKVQLSPGKLRKLEATLAERDLWMTAGTVAMERYQRLQPHRHVSLGALARLLDLASTFGRLAVGLELRPGEAKKRTTRDFEPWDMDPDEALRRAYAVKENAEPSTPGCV